MSLGRRLSTVGLAAVVLAVTSGCFVRLLWLDKGGMDEEDRRECAVLEAPLKARFSFPPSRNPYTKPDDQALYCGIEGRDLFFPKLYTRVVVYGIAERGVQDAILAELRTARGKDFKPVYVVFYDEEIWTRGENPQTGARWETHEYDKQRVLREATIR